MARSQIERIETAQQPPVFTEGEDVFVPNTMDTKLQPPLLGNKRLSRSALLARITEFPKQGGLITIVAPAGSGKSTFQAEIHQLLEAPDHVCCWLSLEPEDDEPAVFAKYMLSALYHLNESFAEKELTFLKANPARDFDSFFDSVIRLISSSDKTVTLFVDDFQNHNDPKILSFWNRLIAHTPASMCIVLASRVRLPLELGRKRMAGTLLEINHKDLNLNPEQMQDFMQNLHAIALPTEAAEMLHNSTEGWIAGLQLAALAINKDDEESSRVIERFSAQDKDLKEYLFQSVLKVQSPEIRDFLLTTACLPKMSADLCNAVTQSTTGTEMLDNIEESNLFLIPLDREKKWFRYHHLFSEFLRNELRRSDLKAYDQVCQRAAVWCQQQGYLTEAIQYCLNAGDYDKAADLIADNAPDIALNQGDHATILDWMRRLPEPYHYKRPEILLNYAWSLAFSREVDKAVAITNEVTKALQPGKDSRWEVSDDERVSFERYALGTQLIAMACTDEFKRCIELCQKLLDELAASPASRRNIGTKNHSNFQYERKLFASTYNTMSYCYYTQKDIAKSTHAAAKAYQYAQESGSLYSVVWGDFLNGLGNVELGRIHAADESANRALQNVGPRTSDNSYIRGLASLIKAEVETQRCDFDEVDRHLTKGKVFSSVFGPLEVILLALRSEARLKAWKGSLEDARKALLQGQASALATHQPRLYFTLAAEEIDLQLRFGDVDSALDTVRRTNLLDNDHPLITADNKANISELSRLTEAKLLLAQGEYDESLRLLSLIYKGAYGNQRTIMIHHVRALKSIALWKMGRESEAVRELDRAITVAAPEGHAYPIVSAGAAIQDVLESIQEKRTSTYVNEAHEIKTAFEKKLISLMRGEKPESVSSNINTAENLELAEPLTDRELEILKLITAGLGNKQLADELLISISTVKWHLHNLYEKIGVRSRTAAAAYARNMNLI